MPHIFASRPAPSRLSRNLSFAILTLLRALAGCGAPQNFPLPPEPNNRPAVRTAERNTQDFSARYDLERDEAHGGHTLQRHVGRTDDQLRERLAREHISAASTWTDRETAEETVAAALSAEQAKVDRWISRGYPRPNLGLHFNAGRPVGRSLRRGEDQSVPCTSAVIVLRAAGPENFYVLTTYPEDRE